MNHARKYLAEWLGTFVLTFMGCGAAIFLGAAPEGGHLAVALAFGLSIVAMAYAIGGVSGCHINPAVSLAAWLDGRLSVKDFVAYVVAQVAGAITGAALLFAIIGMGATDYTGAMATNSVGNIGVFGALAVEVVLTFIFVLTILAVTANAKMESVAGMVIGLTLTFVHIVGIPLTGTSVNPARSIGPALFAGGAPLTELWVFIVAPLVGAALAVGAYKILIKK